MCWAGIPIGKRELNGKGKKRGRFFEINFCALADISFLIPKLVPFAHWKLSSALVDGRHKKKLSIFYYNQMFFLLIPNFFHRVVELLNGEKKCVILNFF